MPKRSNDFQRLIYLVRLNLADGAKVTESKMLRDRRTKAFREVDVVIDGFVGGQAVRVCIECRDHRRVADVQWVEQMKAKHERLDTNALLLASKSGFTPEALNVARSYGIETFTLDDPVESTIRDRLSAASSIWLRNVRITPERVTVTVGGDDGLPPETVVTSPDNLLYLADGSELAQLKELVGRLLSTDVARDTLTQNAKEGDRYFVIHWTPPSKDTGQALYMKKIDPPMLRIATEIRVTGPCVVEIGRFDLRHGRVGNVEVAWGKTMVSGRDAMAVATRDPEGRQTLSINFKGSAPGR